jgi:hypothetical protein
MDFVHDDQVGADVGRAGWLVLHKLTRVTSTADSTVEVNSKCSGVLSPCRFASSQVAEYQSE